MSFIGRFRKGIFWASRWGLYRRDFSTAAVLDDVENYAVGNSVASSSNVNDIEQLRATLSSDMCEKLDQCVKEYELLKYADSKMPTEVTVIQWRRLLTMERKKDRFRYLSYLSGLECELSEKVRTKDEIVALVKNLRADIKEKKEKHIYYGLGGNGIFIRLMDTRITRHMNVRLARAMQFGPRVVVDMSFFPVMSAYERYVTARYLLLMHCHNREHLHPHHLIYANCSPEHSSWAEFQVMLDSHAIGRLSTLTRRSYTDIFPKNQLVYLTPDAKLTVSEYDVEKTYIIGAYADVTRRPRFTLAKAQQEGIEARRLPVEKYVRLMGANVIGFRSLIGILNDAYTGSLGNAVMNNIPESYVMMTNDKREMQRRKREDKERMTYLHKLTSQYL